MAFILSAGLAVALCGCSGTGAVAPQARGEARLGGSQAAEQPLTPQREAAAYARLIAHPGKPGVDYDPRQLMVVYHNGSLPALGAGLAPRVNQAAALPNPMLRQNKAYEAVTDAIAGKYGVVIQQQVYIQDLNLASFDVPPGLSPAAVLNQLRLDFAPQVAYALFSPLEQAQYTPNDPDYAGGSLGEQWDCWRIRCGAAWDITLGDPGVWIAVVDTGVRISHEELTAQVINPAVELPSAHCDVVNNDKIPEDTVGHGTFIAGVIAAEGNNGRSITGVAPQCRVLPIKVSNDGSATSPDSIAGWQLAKSLGAKVINYSFGGYNYVPAEQTAVNQIAAAGVLFVTAAGNEATSQDSYPAAFTAACAVGATDRDDWCSSFSNWGTYVDVAAPGEGLKSATCTGDHDYEYDGAGTSFAAPQVAAAAGLLWSYKPGLTLSEVRTALEQHGGYAYNFAQSMVRLDIKAALDSVAPPVIPTAGGMTVAADSVFGGVPVQPSISVALKQPSSVVRAQYTLDLPPYNDSGASDVVVQSTTAPDFAAVVTVPTAGNYVAQLRAEYFSSTDTAGAPIAAQVYVFNQRGDVNADGVVDLLDLTAYTPLLGVLRGAPGYVPFFDSDLNGVINELDASAVGYFFNGVLPYPEVQSVTPSGGYSSQPVTFSATVSGQAPLSYAWDFGGGAAPNTSTAVSPTVTLGAEGTYNAKLTLSNTYGSDMYDFTLTVGPRPSPTAAFTATPHYGQPPLAVAFDAGASTAPGGSIVNYQWSWDGDTTWEYASSTPTAAHTFDTLGDYTVRLRVTDDLVKTGETTKVIHVTDQPPLDQWVEYDLGLWGRGVSTDNTRLAVTRVLGRTVILWSDDVADGDRTLYLAWAKNSAPTALSDWRIVTLASHVNIMDSFSVAANGDVPAFAYAQDTEVYYGEYDGTNVVTCDVAGGNNSGGYQSLALIGGKPALLVDSQILFESGMTMHYLYSTVAHPTLSTDWQFQTLSMPDFSIDSPYAYTVQLAEVGGRPFLQHQGRAVPGSDSQRIIFYADSATPVAADWHGYGLGDTEMSYEWYGELLQQGALPALALGSEGTGTYQIAYWKSSSAVPHAAGDWQSYSIEEGMDWFENSACVCGGAPAVLATKSWGATEEAVLWLAQVSDPASAADWAQFELPDAANKGNRRVVDHDGQPALLAVIRGSSDTDFRLVYRYPAP